MIFNITMDPVDPKHTERHSNVRHTSLIDLDLDSRLQECEKECSRERSLLMCFYEI